MIAYIKKNFDIIQLIIFKPNTFLETYKHISFLNGLKLLVQLIPFVILIPIATISVLIGLFQLFGLGIDWFQMLKSLALGITGCVMVFVTWGVAAGLISRLVGEVKGISSGMLLGVALSVGFFLQYLRLSSLLIYLISYLMFAKRPTWARFKKLPIIYDEVTQFSFPLFTWHRSLKTFVQVDRISGMKALDFIIQERPWLRFRALRVLFEVGINDLCSIKEFAQIANAPPQEVFSVLQNLPEEKMPKNFKSGDIFLQQIAALVTQYNSFTTIYSRRRQLEIIEQKVKELQRTAPLLGSYVGAGFVKVAQTLDKLVTTEQMALQRRISTEPIPNPFVVGNPLRREDKEVFQGREDVARMLEVEIMRDQSMSPLLLYGKRRIGKTSTLLNLRKLLGPKIIPVYLDGQDAALTQSDASFLYQTFAKIQKEIPIVWTIIDSLILPDHQEFEERTFELSDRLIGQLHERLQTENARVLLCLDEYERLDRAYEQGRITEDLLNQLRHYLQHETRLAFLFAGSHRMTERRAIRWSDYLINVKTIKLSFLDHASAEKLITAPIPDWPLKYDPGVVEQILQITHCQPYLLQAVASDLVDYLNTQQRTRATMVDLEEAIRRVLVTAELYFQNTWEEDLTEPERALILTYLRAEGNIDPVANKEVLHGLVQNDIFEIVDGRHVFVINLFKRWILKNLPV